jgi:hypothetical protein
MKPTCETCKYWVEFDEHDIEKRECHRYPMQADGAGDYSWPPAWASDWCGEHQESENTLTPRPRAGRVVV